MPTTPTRCGPRIPKPRRSATSAKRSLTAGGLGSVGEKAATAIADFVVVDMFANYCTGREDVEKQSTSRIGSCGKSIGELSGGGVTRQSR